MAKFKNPLIVFLYGFGFTAAELLVLRWNIEAGIILLFLGLISCGGWLMSLDWEMDRKQRKLTDIILAGSKYCRPCLRDKGDVVQATHEITEAIADKQTDPNAMWIKTSHYVTYTGYTGYLCEKHFQERLRLWFDGERDPW